MRHYEVMVILDPDLEERTVAPSLETFLNVVKADGGSVDTVEGLSRQGVLADLQEAFLKHNALQCGFCTPGMLMAAADVVQHQPRANRQQVREVRSRDPTEVRREAAVNRAKFGGDRCPLLTQDRRDVQRYRGRPHSALHADHADDSSARVLPGQIGRAHV